MQKVKAINHIGIAVRSIEDQLPYYRDVLGLDYEGEETVVEQKVRVAFLRVGEVHIELLEPTGPDSPVARFIEERGPGLHHLSFTVENLTGRIAELKTTGLQMIDERPRNGAHHMQIAFIHPRSSHGVLTELCQPGPMPHPNPPNE